MAKASCPGPGRGKAGNEADSLGPSQKQTSSPARPSAAADVPPPPDPPGSAPHPSFSLLRPPLQSTQRTPLPATPWALTPRPPRAWLKGPGGMGKVGGFSARAVSGSSRGPNPGLRPSPDPRLRSKDAQTQPKGPPTWLGTFRTFSPMSTDPSLACLRTP